MKRILAGLFFVLSTIGLFAQTTTYSDIQMLSGWVGKTGANIGSVTAPAQYGFIQGIPGSPTALLMYAGGTANTDWLMGLPPMPLPPSFTGNITFGFNLTMGHSWANCGHAWESDTKVDTGGYIYDLSSQNKAGDVQIDNATPSWVDSTINVGPFVPDLPHAILYTYSINTTAHTASVVSYTQDGVVHPVSIALQNIPGKVSTWAPGIYPQFQQDLSIGCTVYTLIDHVTYTIF
jgi:hypothetical protein